MVVIGILAIQGDFAEHESVFQSLGCTVHQVKTIAGLASIDGLVIPGGESTTIKIVAQGETMTALREFAKHKPVWGTCAGLILLADRVTSCGLFDERYGDTMKCMPLTADRNFFGRQNQSFEVTLRGVWDDFTAVFIRAPCITRVAEDVRVLATIDHPRCDAPVMVAASWKNLFVTAFHPELTSDTRIHQYFLETFF